jgi:hypothetical protein
VDAERRGRETTVGTKRKALKPACIWLLVVLLHEAMQGHNRLTDAFQLY